MKHNTIYIYIIDTINYLSIINNMSLNSLSLLLQVTEKVTVFVMDANDERPVFKNLPSFLDVPEVRHCGLHIKSVLISVFLKLLRARRLAGQLPLKLQGAQFK